LVSPAIPAESPPPEVTSPAVIDKGKAILVNVDCKHSVPNDGISPPIVVQYSPSAASPLRPSFLAQAVVPVVVTSPLPSSPVVVGLPAASPTSPLQATEVFSSPSNVTPSDHYSAEDFMEQDGTEDFFLELDDLYDPAISTDSAKKRKFEEGEECSSHSVV